MGDVMYHFDPEWIGKVAQMRERGEEPWPDASELTVTDTSTELHARFFGIEAPEEDHAEANFAIGGRLIFKNVMGKAMFLRVNDGAASKIIGTDESGESVSAGGFIQLYVRKNEVGEELFDALKRLDVGDIIWASGYPMRTRTGELTLRLQNAKLASKILTPFPDRWKSVTDIEMRSRQRYVDLLMNETTRETFRTRSAVVRFIRNFFESRDFMEVETPMLQNKAGGAAARPFVTHHNALDIEMFMRVAPELYLKRLVVGGFPRVFEINRNFRNEGISQKHNPEFTMLEYYYAWATVEDLVVLQEQLLSELAVSVNGSTEIPFGDKVISFSRPFRRADMDELIADATGWSREMLSDPDLTLAEYVSTHEGADISKLPTTVGKWWELLFDEYVEDNLIDPTFVTGFPAEISPLARRSDDDPERVDRFELIINGWEIVNGFTELNDPVDQAGRFEQQVKARADGDDEAMGFDHDYIRALTYGMPPTAGAGMGIDRLVMLLTAKPSIREVILFPTMRPERFDTDDVE
jgi:lysyl-tRNA synthetase class 2